MDATLRCECATPTPCLCFLREEADRISVDELLPRLRFFWNRMLEIEGTKGALRDVDLASLRTVLKATCRADEGSVSRREFFSNRLNGGGNGETFSFWQWFWHALRLCGYRNHEPAARCGRREVARLWRLGVVAGFLDRTQTEAVLARMPLGTGLLRFSQKTLGAIQISGRMSSGEARHRQPYEPAELDVGIVASVLQGVARLTSATPFHDDASAAASVITKEELAKEFKLKPKEKKRLGYEKELNTGVEAAIAVKCELPMV